MKKTINYYNIETAKNPNTSSDILRKILGKGEDDGVSRNAAINPNCPIDAYIKWMQNTGKIGKEDPEKHIIEKIEDNKIDEDLEILKKMVNY